MVQTNDDLLTRSKLRRWRLFAIALLLFLLISSFGFFDQIADAVSGKTFIARIHIDGLITSDDSDYRIAKLSKLSANKNVKAVIVHINSPGGTFVASENLHSALRKLSKNKPVVAVLDDVSASGGYMVAVAADHIIANPGTLTGSIGVIMQYVGVKDLADKLGISLYSIKSSELKGVMSPLDELSGHGKEAMQDVINDIYQNFVQLVSESRNLPLKSVKSIADGRVYTGNQALKLGLIDELGGDDQAVSWLNSSGIHNSIIREFDINQPKSYKNFNFLKSLMSEFGLFLLDYNFLVRI